MISHCKLDYHKFGVSALENRATQVANGIYNNATQFPSPIIHLEDFTHIQNDFNTAAAEYDMYGAVKRTAFTAAKKKLIDTLDLLADYVDGLALGDASLILLSGFLPTSTIPQSNIPLVRIDNFMVKRSANSGEIEVEIPAITGHGAITYYCICSEGAPLENPAIVNGQFQLPPVTQKVFFDYSKSRKKTFSGLTVATVYYFYVFAGNTVSVAPLSDVKQLMAA